MEVYVCNVAPEQQEVLPTPILSFEPKPAKVTQNAATPKRSHVEIGCDSDELTVNENGITHLPTREWTFTSKE